MSIALYIPEVWSARLLANLDKRLVLANAPIINQNWAGEIRNVGDTVHIQRPGNITVGNYTKFSDITFQQPTATSNALVIDQDQYFAFTVDDLDAVQANIDLVDEYTARAACALADQLDQHIAGLYTEAGAGDVAVTLASDDYYLKLVEAGKNLDEKNVPRSGRWHVTSPAGYAALLSNDAFIHATSQGDSVIRTGAVGMAAGFEVYVSNNLTVVAGAPDVTKGLYGTSDAITHARQLLGSPEAVRPEKRFEDAVKGRIAYGSLVVEPNALGTVSLS